jgi:glycosyltransferase involved in cell wall biosynthesis
MNHSSSNNTFLLSICIPTYNRAKLLEQCLNNISKSIIGYEEFIEVIISDNNSSDNTQAVINSFKNRIKNIFSYSNPTNLGFNGNLVKIINEYISGQYCWIIGDDDLLLPCSIKVLFNQLIDTKIDFINFNCDTINIDEIHVLNKKDELEPIAENYYYGRFEDNIFLLTNYENILFTFISASIIRNDILKNINLNKIDGDMWSNVETLFPLAFNYAKLLKGKNCLYIDFPFVTALVHAKDWNWGLPLLHLKYLPELYEHYLEEGFSKSQLYNSKRIIFSCAINSLFKRNNGLLNGVKLKFVFLRKYSTDLDLYFVLLIKIKKIFK